MSMWSKLWFFQLSCTDVRVGPERKLSAKELVLLDCGVGEDSWVPWAVRRSNQSMLKEISPEYSGRTDAEVETPILWPAEVKNWLLRKDPDVGKNWRQEEKRTREDEIVGWHHRFNGYEFEQTPRHSEGQGSMVCYRSWDHKFGHNLATEQQ